MRGLYSASRLCENPFRHLSVRRRETGLPQMCSSLLQLGDAHPGYRRDALRRTAHADKKPAIRHLLHSLRKK